MIIPTGNYLEFKSEHPSITDNKIAISIFKAISLKLVTSLQKPSTQTNIRWLSCYMTSLVRSGRKWSTNSDWKEGHLVKLLKRETSIFVIKYRNIILSVPEKTKLYYTYSEQQWIPNFATTKQNSDKTGCVLIKKQKDSTNYIHNPCTTLCLVVDFEKAFDIFNRETLCHFRQIDKHIIHHIMYKPHNTRNDN